MEYKDYFYKLEKKNPQKVYWIDMCRRDNLSFLDFPMWAGTLSLAFGIFLSKVDKVWSFLLEGTGIAMMVIAVIGSIIIHEMYRNKLKREIKEEKHGRKRKEGRS